MIMDVNELMDNEKIVKLDKEIFNIAKEKYKNYKNDIEAMRFLFQNCCYNKNRLKEEFERSRKGFGIPKPSELQNIVKKLKIKNGQTFKVEIPITLWAYIYLFEFHSFLSNLIRCCNFITKFKLKLIDGFKPQKSPTLVEYHSKNYDKHIKSNNELDKFLRRTFEEWIENVNKIRNEVVHGFIELALKGHLIIKITKKFETEVLYKGDVKVSLPSINIKDIEAYSNTHLDKIESFIREFFGYLI